MKESRKNEKHEGTKKSVRRNEVMKEITRRYEGRQRKRGNQEAEREKRESKLKTS